MKRVVSFFSTIGRFTQQHIIPLLSPAIVLFAIVWHLFFAEKNYFDVCRNDERIRELQQAIDQEKALIVQLEEEILDSKSDIATIDRIARERHGMQRSHEDVYVTILPLDTSAHSITKD